jgi:short-subunit dehydrogenase
MDYRTAFITGASSGIGRALATRLAREGVSVGLCARREDRLVELRDIIEREGGSARIYACDVADAEAVQRTIERADAEMQGLDLVVANAGISKHRWGGKLSFTECSGVVRVNVEGALATLLAVLPRMVERRRGHLVGISSLAQYRGLPYNAVYSASKAFLSTFLESLRIDLRSTGVAVTDVRPGFVESEMTKAARFPTPFLMKVDDAAEVIVQGIAQRAPVVAFPWQMAAVMRGARLLPIPIYERIARGVRRPSR